ncbi:uncharacterized protein HMPREF1541_06437 [Cyphellophora europaea CBS 101466]|uniref:Cytidyltransferase-like domain-containing protein n=1 Tax=Cyphellophora europaea (strain CBS 101466) TaxID=1220924 RepID=W2RPM2_CYPE1|nr:uncharacterized protein HMPREF1541_06437 [Cyphellophora europaea CBS 101466]ETN38402.1 hypothetical protein HMPREF1541_06437 [Cyphellophora europaea CBS 101466]
MAPIDTAPRALFLLPALSLPLSRPSLRTAYKGTFEALLAKLKSKLSKDSIYRLDIAVALSTSYPSTVSTSRTALFPDLQTLIQETYTLVCLTAVSADIDLDIPGGIDVRIILIDPASATEQAHISGPLITFPTLLSAPPPSLIFSTESESGITLDKAFITAYQSIHRSTPSISRLPCGPSLTTSIPTSPLLASTFQSITTAPTPPSQVHHSVAVGGTFDHLHIGHKLLLTATLLLASPTPPSQHRTITVGITGDSLLTKKSHAAVLESWSTRQQRCAAFIDAILAFHNDTASLRSTSEQDELGPNGKVVRVTYTPPTGASGRPADSAITINYTRIEDPYGPTITDESISALVVSAETRAGGAAVNEKRREKGWRELEVFEVGVLDASPGEGDDEADGEDVRKGFAGKISSTEIRKRLAGQAENGT